LSRVIENPKQLILSNAKKILYNQGYHKLSMRALSKACDIALGTIYNYYPTKKDLIVEMMTEYWQNYLDSVQEIATSNTDLYIKLNNIGGTAGKTGTAQAILNKQKTIHGWFAGVYPAYEPKYTITVFIEDASSGSMTAAPIFEKIVKEIYKLNP